MKKLTTLATALVVLSLSSGAHAANWATSSYTGVGFVDEGDFDDESFSSSFSLVYRFGDTLGLEAGYTSFGDFENDFGSGATRGEARADIDGFTIGLNWLGAINEQWYLTARAGLWAWDGEVEVRGPNFVAIRGEDDGTDFYAGVGFGYRFTERFGAGLGLSYYGADLDDEDTGLTIVGLNTNYRF
jgi:OOP family OmpA-OmpF porin/outer membrane immunogenic protein